MAYLTLNIGTLRIKFTKNMAIPDELDKIQIGRLALIGQNYRS